MAQKVMQELASFPIPGGMSGSGDIPACHIPFGVSLGKANPFSALYGALPVMAHALTDKIKAAKLIETIGPLSGRCVRPTRGGLLIPGFLVSVRMPGVPSCPLTEEISTAKRHQNDQEGRQTRPE